LFRLRLAAAWEEWRIPLGMLALALLFASFYIDPIAHILAWVALIAAAPLTVFLAARSTWHERRALSMTALLIALLTVVAADVAVAGSLAGTSFLGVSFSGMAVSPITRSTLIAGAVAAALWQFCA